ncbi:DUF1838 family protein [Altererythrobacter sp. GH1-8]|uniref:DUF1838 family protein n=1 Tax=Altererythrobacter sp. GH1-8 TaxID=3349333 RepID=UPI00374D6BC3
MAAAATVLPEQAFAATSKADEVAALDPLETMVRMRGRTDGGLTMTWLDADRSLVLDGTVYAFCRMIGLLLTRFRKDGDSWYGNTFEVMYYCDPATSKPLGTTLMPGGSEPVEVPVYRSGPQELHFKRSLDIWVHPEQSKQDPSYEAFAPPASVHMQRQVHDPYLHDGTVFLRADEYGRIYPDLEKPPAVFYREWKFWQAAADEVLDANRPGVSSRFTYSAVSGLRPWMKLNGVNGHTVSNGIGARVDSMDKLPANLIALLEENEPRALETPQSYVPLYT